MKYLKNIAFLGCVAFIINDFITLLKGATFTPFGIATFLIVMVIGCELEESLKN